MNNKSCNNNICCFFGHQNTPPSILPLLIKEIKNLIKNNNVNTFWVGGLGKFDVYAEKVIKIIKIKYPEIQLCMIPAYFLVLEKQNEFIESECEDTSHLYALELVRDSCAVAERNRWIVEKCEHMISYVNHKHGVAYAAYKYAKELNRNIINIGKLDK